MKKVLVLVSLGFVALSFSCGGSGGAGGETAANVETAAGMSSAVMGAAGDNLFAGAASVDELIDTVSCPINGTIAVDLTTTDAGSGTLKLTYDKCGVALCDGHLFMNGTLDETFSVASTTYTYGITGTINFISAAEAEWDVPGAIVYYAGQACGIDIVMDINTTDLSGLDTEAEIVAYINSHVTGTVCGYDWADAVALDIDTTDLSGSYCTTLTI